MKAIELLVRNALPAAMRDHPLKLDGGGIADLMARVAREHPDAYADVVKKINDAGRNAAYTMGESLTLDDLRPVLDTKPIYKAMDAEVAKARASTSNDKEFAKKREAIWIRYSDELEPATVKESQRLGTGLAYAVASGARGKAAQLKAMITTPGVYQDSVGQMVPIFVRHSFSQGLRPFEHMAGSYGARATVISTKRATAKGGDLCLSEGTLVRMADLSTRRIEEIKCGDWVLGSDRLGNTAPARVSAVFVQGLQPCIKHLLKFAHKKELETLVCTGAHKFAGKFTDKKIGLREAVLPIADINSRWVIRLNEAFDSTGMIHEPLAFVIGAMLGDGSCGNEGPKSRLHFTSADPKLVVFMNAKLNQIGVQLIQTKGNPIQYRISMFGKTTGRSGARFAHPLKAKLHSLGLLGSKAHTKHVPDVCYQWDNASVSDFLAGYLATDGCVSTRTTGGKRYPTVSFSSVSRKLLQGIDNLLTWRFGLRASIFEVTKEKRTGFAGNGSAFLLTLSGVENLKKFSAVVGVNGMKQERLVKLIPDIYKTSRQNQAYIKSREPAGDLPCFDIEVDNADHLFVLANGLITSNSKQLGQTASHLLVSEEDCGAGDGLDQAVGKELRGRVLGQAAAGMDAGTVLDRDAIAVLQRKKVESVIVRSPLTCRSVSGICAHCAGADAYSKLPPIGEMVGVTAAQAIGEPLAQAALSSKHTAGQAKGTMKYTGFEYLSQLVQAPEVFKDRAPVAEEAGRITRVTPAPQGGTHIHVNGRQHYVAPGQESMVKEGDEVEAGDALSDGLVDPRDIVRLRGLGEGRRYMAERLKQMLDDGGVSTSARHTEMMAKATLDHVVIDEADEEQGIDGTPDDVVFYSKVASQYIPPKDARRVNLTTSKESPVGKFLSAPAMHYTIGTQLTPRMVKKLSSSGVNDISIQDKAPPFSADMMRLRTATHATDDWMVRMNSSYLTKGLEDSMTSALDTNVQSNGHWMPRLAYGENFGKDVGTTGKF